MAVALGWPRSLARLPRPRRETSVRRRARTPDEASILSSYVHSSYLRELLSDGRLGYAYLLKTATIEEIRRAILTAARGGFLIDPQVGIQATDTSQLTVLTPREARAEPPRLLEDLTRADVAGAVGHARLAPVGREADDAVRVAAERSNAGAPRLHRHRQIGERLHARRRDLAA